MSLLGMLICFLFVYLVSYLVESAICHYGTESTLMQHPSVGLRSNFSFYPPNSAAKACSIELPVLPWWHRALQWWILLAAFQTCVKHIKPKNGGAPEFSVSKKKNSLQWSTFRRYETRIPLQKIGLTCIERKKKELVAPPAGSHSSIIPTPKAAQNAKVIGICLLTSRWFENVLQSVTSVSAVWPMGQISTMKQNLKTESDVKRATCMCPKIPWRQYPDVFKSNWIW